MSSNVKKIKTAVEEEYFKHEWPWSCMGGQHPDAKWGRMKHAGPAGYSCHEARGSGPKVWLRQGITGQWERKQTPLQKVCSEYTLAWCSPGATPTTASSFVSHTLITTPTIAQPMANPSEHKGFRNERTYSDKRTDIAQTPVKTVAVSSWSTCTDLQNPV